MNELCHAFLIFLKKVTIDEWNVIKGLFTDVHRCKMQKWWMKLSINRVVEPEKSAEVQKWCWMEWMNVCHHGYSNWPDKKRTQLVIWIRVQCTVA
jgi:hypothetical protein